MTTEFSIDDAFALEREDEVEYNKEREAGDVGSMSFGPLSFSKPQGLPVAVTGTLDHSSLKYQVAACPRWCTSSCVRLVSDWAI